MNLTNEVQGGAHVERLFAQPRAPRPINLDDTRDWTDQVSTRLLGRVVLGVFAVVGVTTIPT